MTGETGSAAHWDGAYNLGDTTRSWFQDRPDQSLRMFEAAGVCSADSVIDVGGGASTLVDALLARGTPMSRFSTFRLPAWMRRDSAWVCAPGGWTGCSPTC